MEAILYRDSGYVQKLIEHIVVKYLAQLYCVCVIWNSFDSNQIADINWAYEKNDFQTMIWLKYDKAMSDQLNINEIIQTSIENGCQAVILGPNSAIDFLDAYENMRYNSNIRYHSIHVVALPTRRNNTEKYIQQILNHATVQNIPNVLIISPSKSTNGTQERIEDIDDSSFDLITSRFGTQSNSNDLRYLDTFNALSESFLENADLFPNKLSNLEGRVVRLALIDYKPFAIYDKVPADTGNANAIGSNEEKTLQLDGTEALMHLAFCEVYNCTVAVTIEEEGQWGYILDNMTGIGILGAIAERRAEVGICALFLWHNVYKFLEFSSAMSRSGVPCLCPRPKLLSGWLLPTEPFSFNMWTAEFIAFASIFLSIIFVRAISMNDQPDIGSSFLQTWAIFMLQSVQMAKQHLPELIICIVALQACQLIANAYTGGLASIMTVPQYEEPIDSSHQLAAKDMDWGGTDVAWTFSILESTSPDLVKLRKMFKAISFQELANRTQTGDYCFVLERLPYGHYSVGDWVDVEAINFLRIMHYDIYYDFCVTMSYKTWPFKTVFDLHVLHVFESGIQKYWELMSLARHTDMNIQLGISISRDRPKAEPVRLTIDHVSGAFILFTIGCICATFAFIMELMVYRLQTKYFIKRNKILIC